MILRRTTPEEEWETVGQVMMQVLRRKQIIGWKNRYCSLRSKILCECIGADAAGTVT